MAEHYKRMIRLSEELGFQDDVDHWTEELNKIEAAK